MIDQRIDICPRCLCRPREKRYCKPCETYLAEKSARETIRERRTMAESKIEK